MRMLRKKRIRKVLHRLHNGILYAITTVFFAGCFGSMFAIGTMTTQGHTLKDYAVAAGILIVSMIWFTIFFQSIAITKKKPPRAATLKGQSKWTLNSLSPLL